MLDAHSRRQQALDAIDAVLNGAKAADCETEVVDFKEEAGTVEPKTKQRTAIASEHEPAARALAGEAACMATGESGSGGVLVVGVDDTASGPAAFVGTHLDTEWLRRRIYALTQPSLALDVIEELKVADKRIYLINVAPSLEEIRSGGKLRARFGTDCVELTGDRARRFLERRRNFDWSAEPSGLRLSGAVPEALESAHRHYEERHGKSAGSDLALVKRLGVALSDEAAPELSRAGALLLCRFDAGVEQLDVRITRAEGSASQHREQLESPMLLAYDTAWEILADAFPAELVTVGAQRRNIRAIPDEALREALANAVSHREYQHPRASIVALAIGDPVSTLKVTSPGGFPYGVQGDRLLASSSRPRNPMLANAMRVLGLGEGEGVGISTMFRLMLRDGHPEPEIYGEDGKVVCRLPGGSPNRAVREFFDGLGRRDRGLGESVRAHIAINELLQHPVLRPERLATIAQCTTEEALETLNQLSHIDAVEQLVNRSRSFRLTDRGRAQLAERLNYRTRQSLDEHWDMVRAHLDVHDEIGSADAADLLGLTRVRASNILSQLYNDRRLIEPVGSARGRGVRYKLPSRAGPPAR